MIETTYAQEENSTQIQTIHEGKHENDNETYSDEDSIRDCFDLNFSYRHHGKIFLKECTHYLMKSFRKKDEEYFKNYENARQLVNYENAPDFLKHNSYIQKGYRKILNTEHCIESIFWWTNESVNIWSHLFGLFLFIGLTINDLLILKVQASFSDKFIVASVLVCFQICMTLSSIYHTFNCRSEKDCDIFLSFDLFGIALSILAINTSGIYYAFWCNTELQQFYISTVTFIFLIAMVLQIPQLKVDSHVKMLVFVAWAAYGVIPTVHWAIVMGGFENPIVKLLLPRVLGMYTISGTAFFIYITKIPERFCNGYVDFIGHSHQWWHLFVVFALYYWHNTGMLYVDYRLNHACSNHMRLP